MQVPFLRPDIRDSDIERMIASLKTGWLVYGEEAAATETELEKYLNAKNAILTSSCTAALHLALVLAGVDEGDEVITTPLSWVSTSDVILYQRARVVFADVDPKTGLIDAKEVEKKITPRTKAIIPVHLYGQMADMRALSKLARENHLVLIEDAAHALESSRDGIRPGELGNFTALSFHAAKNITSGQGGALLIKDSSLEMRARALRRNGVLGRNENRRKHELGYKYDGTDFQAVLISQQLKRIAATHKKRLAVWRRYEEGLRDVGGLSFPARARGVDHAAHMFVIWVDPARRDDIRTALAKSGISTSIHWDPIHLEPFYRNLLGHGEGDFPHAERLGLSTISLPTYPSLTKKEQDYVIRAVRDAVRI